MCYLSFRIFNWLIFPSIVVDNLLPVVNNHVGIAYSKVKAIDTSSLLSCEPTYDGVSTKKLTKLCN